MTHSQHTFPRYPESYPVVLDFVLPPSLRPSLYHEGALPPRPMGHRFPIHHLTKDFRTSDDFSQDTCSPWVVLRYISCSMVRRLTSWECTPIVLIVCSVTVPAEFCVDHSQAILTLWYAPENVPLRSKDSYECLLQFLSHQDFRILRDNLSLTLHSIGAWTGYPDCAVQVSPLTEQRLIWDYPHYHRPTGVRADACLLAAMGRYSYENGDMGSSCDLSHNSSCIFDVFLHGG